MNPTSTARRGEERFLPSMLIVACLPLLLYCGGGGGGGGNILPQVKTPTFKASGTASAPDLVTLSFGGTAPGSLIQTDVKLGGPTTSSSIYSFSFYLVLSNPSIVREVTAVAGNALTGDQSPPQVSLQGDRVVVGVTKLGPIPGNGVGTDGATIAGLIFKLEPTSPGTTTLTFDPTNAIVQDPQGVTIGTIKFDSASAEIEQPK